MYKCCNFKRFLKLILCDIIVISIMFTILNIRQTNWFATTAVTDNEKIFIPVIMYHIISENPKLMGDYVVSPQTIENDLIYLTEKGYTTILIKDVINYIQNDIPLPEKPIIITFDDGYFNNYVYLMPLIEKYNMKFIISIVGEYIEKEVASKEPQNKNYSYLTWDNIIDLHNTGNVEIGNHTYNLHTLNNRNGSAILPGENEEDYVNMLKENVGKLQSMLLTNANISPIIFTYPYGFHSQESIPVLKELGFKATFTCKEQPNYITKNLDCLYGLNRYNRPYGISTEQFMEYVLNNR